MVIMTAFPLCRGALRWEIAFHAWDFVLRLADDTLFLFDVVPPSSESGPFLYLDLHYKIRY